MRFNWKFQYFRAIPLQFQFYLHVVQGVKLALFVAGNRHDPRSEQQKREEETTLTQHMISQLILFWILFTP